MPDPSRRLPVGVTLTQSGTHIAAAIGDAATARGLVTRSPAPPDPDAAIGLIEALIRRVAAEQHAGGVPVMPSAVGIALAGQVDARAGTVRALPQAPRWAGFPLAQRLRDALGVPVRVSSDVDAAALAEARLGAGVDAGAAADASPLLYVSLGRDVEASIVVEGQVLAGAHGLAGRLGHVRVAEGGPRCTCGATGHLAPIASSQAVVRTMIGRASDRDESLAAMLRITGGRAEAITAPQVVALAEEGDPVAQDVVGAALNALALGLAAAVELLDPALIVLAGPLAESGDAFLRPLSVRLRALGQRPSDMPPVVPARLGARAALAGALLLAGQVAGQPGA